MLTWARKQGVSLPPELERYADALSERAAIKKALEMEAGGEGQLSSSLAVPRLSTSEESQAALRNTSSAAATLLISPSGCAGAPRTRGKHRPS
jgi:hypothetical protein